MLLAKHLARRRVIDEDDLRDGRTRGGEPIFDDDADREAFLATVGAALERFDGCALSYCLMDNHYHLVLAHSCVSFVL